MIGTFDLAWLCGLLEGEGTFFYNPQGNKAILRVQMIDVDTLERLAGLLGTHYTGPYIRNRSGREHPIYAVSLYGGSAVALMRLIQPMMGQRRQQAIMKVVQGYRGQVISIAPPEQVDDRRMISLYWLAGLLEAEGTFHPPTPSEPNKPAISVSMTDEDVIARVANIWNRSYQQITKGDFKRQYRTQLTGRRAVALMHEILPLMSLRRQQQIATAVATYDPNRQQERPNRVRGARSHRAKIDDEALVLELYQRAWAGESAADLAREKNVSEDAIRHIKAGRSWSWLTGHKK